MNFDSYYNFMHKIIHFNMTNFSKTLILFFLFQSSILSAQTSISEAHKKILGERAVNFVKDFHITLNLVADQPVDNFKITDYFDTLTSPVYHDLKIGLERETLHFEKYIFIIEQWYQSEVEFSIKKTEVKEIKQDENHVFISVLVKRLIKFPK